MAFRVVRLRREARRLAKLEEIFTVSRAMSLFDVTHWPSCSIYPIAISRVSIKWLVTRMETLPPFVSINIDNVSQEKDRNQSGSLHVDQVAEIFRVYEVNSNTICLSGNGLVMSNFLWLSGQSWWGGGTKSNNKQWTDFKGMVKSSHILIHNIF